MIMTLRRQRLIAAFLGLVIAAAASGSRAQEAKSGVAATGLPGGASSLTETHGDWTVSCAVRPQGEQSVRLCAFSQQQINNQGQRALAIELRPSEAGAGGVMVLPFGLALSQGVTLRIDEGEAGAPLPFSTCLPAGCIVPVNFDTGRLDALSQGTNVNVAASAINGGETKLTISLTGFISALNRTRELAE